MERAKILDIKHFAVHDGEGIRTTVFLKGCPLKCIWCHNPEGIGYQTQIGYVSKRCINCGECTLCCEANTMVCGLHVFDRKKCTECGRCAEVCLGGAFSLHGRMMSSEEVFEEVKKDMDFYQSTGGGITLSGGECLLQYNFCKELLGMCKDHGIHTAVDTCGYVEQKALDAVREYTDIFLYDLKAMNEEVHIRCTGSSNQKILENLQYIDDWNIPIEIRIPFVPGYNDDQITKMAEFLKNLKNISGVKVLPYHNMAGTKYEAVGMKNTMPEKMPAKEQLKRAQDEFKKAGFLVKD